MAATPKKNRKKKKKKKKRKKNQIKADFFSSSYILF